MISWKKLAENDFLCKGKIEHWTYRQETGSRQEIQISSSKWVFLWDFFLFLVHQSVFKNFPEHVSLYHSYIVLGIIICDSHSSLVMIATLWEGKSISDLAAKVLPIVSMAKKIHVVLWPPTRVRPYFYNGRLQFLGFKSKFILIRSSNLNEIII